MPVCGIIDAVRVDYDLGAKPVNIQPGFVGHGCCEGEFCPWKLAALVKPPFTQYVAVAPMLIGEQQCLSKMVVRGVNIQPIVSIGIDNAQVEKPVSFFQGERIFVEPAG